MGDHYVAVRQDVYGLADRARARRIGLLSQQRESPESISVEELVMHGRYPYRGFLEPVSEDDTWAVERALELAEITHLRSRTLNSLSGGQTQLVWIAMVLAQEPDVLLLDEPTTFLDLRHQLQVMHTVETLNQGQDVTVGIVLHDIAQAARYADTLIVMEDGAAYDWGPPSQVVTEELLATVFDVEAIVRTGDSDTGPDVILQRPVHDCSRG